MRVYPITIGAIPNISPRRALRIHSSSKKTSKSGSVTGKKGISGKKGARKLSKKVESVVEFDQPEFCGEDPDSSDFYWNKKQHDPTFTNDEVFEVMLKSALQSHENMFHKIKGYTRFYITPIMSLQHLTLPEALIYFNIIAGQFKHESASYTWHVKTDDQPADTLAFPIYLETDRNKLLKRTLLHKPKTKRTAIYENERHVGSFKHYVRQRKLEEIEGTYKGKKIVLDPVWLTKNSIKHEHIRLGNTKTDLIPNKQVKQGYFRGTQFMKMSVTNIKSEQFDANHFITYKKATIGHLQLEIKLVFWKYCLVPVSGVITIRN